MTKDEFKLTKIPHEFLFLGRREPENLLPVNLGEAKYVRINCAISYKYVTLLFIKSLVIMVGHVFKNVMSQN